MTRDKNNSHSSQRRRFLQLSGLALGGLALNPLTGISRAYAADDEILIGYWPIVGGLPLYAGIEKGIFRQAGLNVRAVKFASPQQVVESMLTGRIHGCANGTATGALGLGEISSPGLFKIICANPSNKNMVLDEFLIPMNSNAKSIADLKGKKIASGPGIQNVTMAKIILEKNGFVNPQVIELPVGQHAPSLAAGQIDGVYTLEPTGTVARVNHMGKVLETGVISRYVLGDENAPWFGGAAALTHQFLNADTAKAQAFIKAYGDAADFVSKNPVEARKYIAGYTSITPALVSEVPLPGFVMYPQLTGDNLQWFQKFYDVFTDRKIFRQKVDVSSLIYRA